MERRKFLIGAGSLAAGSAAAVGTGAFTSVSAQRNVTVQVEDDMDAFLQLDSTLKSSTNDVFASTENGRLVIDVSNTDAGGEGVNENAVTTLDQVFKLQNHGTQPVNIWFDHDIPGLTFYRFDPDSNSLDGAENAKIGLATGAHMKIGIEVDTTADGAGDVDEIGGTVTIRADAEDPA
jgi:hypothetical protein